MRYASDVMLTYMGQSVSDERERHISCIFIKYVF